MLCSPTVKWHNHSPTTSDRTEHFEEEGGSIEVPTIAPTTHHEERGVTLLTTPKAHQDEPCASETAPYPAAASTIFIRASRRESLAPRSIATASTCAFTPCSSSSERATSERSSASASAAGGAGTAPALTAGYCEVDLVSPHAVDGRGMGSDAAGAPAPTSRSAASYFSAPRAPSRSYFSAARAPSSACASEGGRVAGPGARRRLRAARAHRSRV